jgi:hypothetical protein
LQQNRKCISLSAERERAKSAHYQAFPNGIQK